MDFYHNEDDEEYGGLASFSTNMNAILDYIIEIPAGKPYAGNHIITNWENPSGDNHQMTFVGYNDSVCYDFNGDGYYTDTVDLNGDDLITMADWEWGALKVVNSWGFLFGDSGYVYLPYHLLARDTVINSVTFSPINGDIIHVLYVSEEYKPEITLRMKLTHPLRDELKISADSGQNANSGHPVVPLQSYKAYTFNGGPYPVRGSNNSDPIELSIDFNYFYSEADLGKVFLFIHDARQEHTNSTLYRFSMVDYRWDETFELISPHWYEAIDQKYNWFSIEYDLIPHEDTITENLNLFSNMVSRFTPTVANNATLSVDDSVKIDFYGSHLVITEGSTLSLGDHVVLTGKRDSSSIDIYGNLQIGSNVTFAADNDCELYLNFLNDEGSYTVNAVDFDGAAIASVCDSLTISSGTFNNGHIEKSGGSLLVDDCVFENSYVYALEGRESKIIEISDCDFNNPVVSHSPVMIDYYDNFDIHDNIIRYCYGAGISLYNAGGVDGEDTFEVTDNEIYRTESKRAELKDLGIKVYNSKVKILNGNEIHHNDIGISCLDYSQTKIKGYEDEDCDDLQQKIYNNSEHQVYLSRASFPTDFNYNRIYLDTIDTTYLIYEKLNYQVPIQCDVEHNFWGDSINDPSAFIYTTLRPDYTPICNMKDKEITGIESAYDSAVNYVMTGQYQLAEDKFKEIVEGDSASAYAYASLNQLFELKEIFDQDYQELKQYLNTTTILQDTNDLGKLADVISNKCDIEMGNYQAAIDFYEDIILYSESFQDSLFAIIDLGYLYMRMNSNGNRPGYTCLLPQYIPKSRSLYEIDRDRLINLLFTDELVQSVDDVKFDEFGNHPIRNLVLFPNPVSHTLNLSFQATDNIKLRLSIYDQCGRLVRNLGSAQYGKGTHELRFDMTKLTNGVYFLSMKNKERTIVNKKLLLVK